MMPSLIFLSAYPWITGSSGAVTMSRCGFGQIFLARWFFPNFSRPWRGTICKILEFFFVGVKQLGNSSSCKAKCSFAILIGGLSNSFNMFFCLFAMYFFFAFFCFAPLSAKKTKHPSKNWGHLPQAGRKDEDIAERDKTILSLGGNSPP